MISLWVHCAAFRVLGSELKNEPLGVEWGLVVGLTWEFGEAVKGRAVLSYWYYRQALCFCQGWRSAGSAVLGENKGDVLTLSAFCSSSRISFLPEAVQTSCSCTILCAVTIQGSGCPRGCTSVTLAVTCGFTWQPCFIEGTMCCRLGSDTCNTSQASVLWAFSECSRKREAVKGSCGCGGQISLGPRLFGSFQACVGFQKL